MQKRRVPRSKFANRSRTIRGHDLPLRLSLGCAGLAETAFPRSQSFFRSSRGRAAEVDLLVLLDEEVPAPRDFDGVGGGGHGACGAQGGEHQSDGLRELERASEDTRLYLEDSENRV